MKQIGLIATGMVVLIMAVVVFIKLLPQAKVMIKTVGPTGEFWVGTNNVGKEMRWPIWRFAVTNTGRAEAKCGLFLHLEGTSSLCDGHPFAYNDHRAEWLKPHQGRFMTTAVPPGPDTRWIVYANYQSIPSATEGRISPLIWNISPLKRLLPRHDELDCSDGWHKTTNEAPGSYRVH